MVLRRLKGSGVTSYFMLHEVAFFLLLLLRHSPCLDTRNEKAVVEAEIVHTVVYFKGVVVSFWR